MKFLPVSRQSAKRLSELLWELMKNPEANRPGDVTTQYCDVVDHPTRADVSTLVLPDEPVKLHPLANGSKIQQLLQQFVDRGDITPGERGKVGTDIAANRGRSVKVEDFLPNSWKQYLMDEQTAKDTGWLPINEEARQK